MNYDVVPAFTSPIIQVEVEEDTSELLGHNQYTASFETSQRLDHSNPLASQRVLEKYPKTKEILLNKYISVAEKILQYKKRNYAITTSWFTLSKKGQGSQSHKHKNSFWSCVYYYQEEYSKGTGGILFHSPNTDLFDFAFFENDIEKQNNINSRSLVIQPQPNLLLIFPSYLQHQILKHDNDTPRSSLAFNIVPLGNWGAGDSHLDSNWFQ
tara:strand:- start:815 stop:1447 length:633 start_codon:yes stop_codon:yes gene_type:complete